MIHLHTLGDALITVGEKEVRPSSPMVFAALLYLGVERGRRVPRAALQEMFFPEADERSGSHSVRQLLYKLRQLGAPVIGNETTVSVESAQVLDACSMQSARFWTDSDAAAAAVGFVPEYSPDISPRFEEWLELQRTTVAARLRITLVTLLLDRRSRSEWASVASIAQSLLNMDPLNEEATLALAEALAISGGKHKALSMLSTYEGETGSALRLAPSLLRRRISESFPSQSFDGPYAPILAGRAAELSILTHRVRQPESLRSRISLVVGDAGIGKSRLLEELVRVASVEGIRPFMVRCRPHYAERPLSVFIELVPELLRSPGALGVSPESLKYLRKLIHKDPENSASDDIDDDASKSELLRRALSDLFDAVRSEQTFLLVLEDLHWSDRSSLTELKIIASQFPSIPIVASSRSVDQLRGHFDDLADIVRLPPLSNQHMAEIVTDTLGQNVDNETKDWCAKVANGNPLFLIMLCCHIRQTGARTVPLDLTAIISSRLALLPEPFLRAIQYVALLGPYCTVTSLRELLGLTPSKFIDCISRLEDQSYLTVRNSVIGLNHDLVNEVSLGLAAPVTRKALHAHVASYLQSQFEQSGNTAALWDCAEEWRLSGELQKSTQLLRRCASHASALGHSGKALTILTLARQHISGEVQLAELLNEMIIAATAAGQFDDVLRLSQDARSLPRPPHGVTEILECEAEWLLNGTLDVARLFTCLTDQSASNHHRFEACLILQRYAHEICDHILAERSYAAVADLRPDAEPLDRLLVELVHHATFGDNIAGLRAIEELSALAKTMIPVGDRLRAGRNIVVALLAFGRATEAIARADSLRQQTAELGLATRHYEFEALLGACFLAVEDFPNAERCLSKLGPPPDRSLIALHNMLGIELSLWRGDGESAQRLYEEVEFNASFQSTRSSGYLRGVELRLKQLDPQFVCSELEFQAFLSIYDSTKLFLSEDGLARALAEDLRRRNAPHKALRLLNDYANNSRRQCCVLTPSFEAFRTRLESDVGVYAA